MGIHPDKENLKIISCYKDGSIAVRDLMNEESEIEFFNGKHDTDVNCILLSSDNQKLISGDKNGTIKVWNVRTGELLRTVFNKTKDGLKYSIKCLINSPLRPNEILIASCLSHIRVLDLNSYYITLKLKAHSQQLNSIEFLTNEILLSSSTDSTIKIWNLELSKTSLQTIECHPNEPMILRKITETTFACLHENGIIKIFSSDKESVKFKCYKTLICNSGSHSDLKVCSDLNLLICSTDVIHLFSLTDFTCVATLCKNRGSFSRSIAILPNNRLIVANDNKTLVMWCLKTGKSLSVHKDHSSLTNNILFYNN